MSTWNPNNPANEDRRRKDIDGLFKQLSEAAKRAHYVGMGLRQRAPKHAAAMMRVAALINQAIRDESARLTAEIPVGGEGSANEGGRRFLAGDVVKHRPSGETWQLATDEENGNVRPCGWPPTLANASDCVLTKAASAEKRKGMLDRWSTKVPDERDGPDERIAVARGQVDTTGGAR